MDDAQTQQNAKTKRLYEIMGEHGLRAPDVAELIGRSSQTVRMWRCESKVIPDHALAALEFAIAQRKQICEQYAYVIFATAMLVHKNRLDKR